MLSYRYLPLNIFLGYSVFVLFALVVGPINYYRIDLPGLALFLVPLVMLFFVGFVLGARGPLYTSLDDNFMAHRGEALAQIHKLFRVMLAISTVSALGQWAMFATGERSLSLTEIGTNYVTGYDGYERGAASVDGAYVFNIFDQALTVVVLLVSIYYYRLLSRGQRAAVWFVISSYLIINVIGSGKQKYLGDIIVFVAYGSALNFAARRARIGGLVGILVSLGLLMASMAFVEILAQRYVAAGVGLDNIHEKLHPLMSWNDDAPLIEWLPEDYAISFGMFLAYFTNGLYGLSLSLQLPFDWSYFVGNSYSLGRIVEILLGAPGAVLTHTLPYRVGELYGWDATKWHTLFSWMASDLSFPGVLLVTPFFGFIYAKTWVQAVKGHNPFAGPLFIFLSLGVVFSYSNNQLLHSLQGVLVLSFLSLAYLRNDRRHRQPRAELATAR